MTRNYFGNSLITAKKNNAIPNLTLVSSSNTGQNIFQLFAKLFFKNYPQLIKLTPNALTTPNFEEYKHYFFYFLVLTELDILNEINNLHFNFNVGPDEIICYFSL